MTLLPVYVYINTYIQQHAHWNAVSWLHSVNSKAQERNRGETGSPWMKPLCRYFKASLCTISLPAVFPSIELPGEQHTYAFRLQHARNHTLSHVFCQLSLIDNDISNMHLILYTSVYIYVYIMFLFSPKRCGFRLNAHEAFRRSSCDAFVGVGVTDTYPVTNGDQRRLDTHWATFLRPFLASTIRACVPPLRHFPRSSVVWTISNIWGIFEQLLRREHVCELFFFFYGVSKFFNV